MYHGHLKQALTLRGLPATHDAKFYAIGPGRIGLGGQTVAAMAMITSGLSVGQRVKLTSDNPHDVGSDFRQGDVGVVVRVNQAHVDVLFARTGETVVCLGGQLEVCDG